MKKKDIVAKALQTVNKLVEADGIPLNICDDFRVLILEDEHHQQPGGQLNPWYYHENHLHRPNGSLHARETSVWMSILPGIFARYRTTIGGRP